MQFRMSKLSAVALALTVATGAASADTLLSEGFENVAALSSVGWIFGNASAPNGLVAGWFQGDGIFTAESGSVNSYVASNYNVSAAGGQIANWMITPTFSTEVAGSVSFWVKAANEVGYSDQLAFGFSSGGSNPFNFTLSAPVTIGGEWTQITLNFAAGGAGSVGRFAIEHVGAADSSNYVAVDNLSIANSVSAVPEPQAWLLMGLGLAGVGFIKRRRDEA